MKITFAEKHPYTAIILIGLLCTFLTALGMAVPQIIGLAEKDVYITATGFLILSILAGLFIMGKSKRPLKDYGFHKNEKESTKKVWWYLPLVVIEIIPIIMYGFSSELSVEIYFILALFTIAIGFNEEIYFRGLALKLLEAKGNKAAIAGTSILFGVLHSANAFNGKTSFYLILQMFFAFLAGFILAEVVSITKSLWAPIIWHAAHDFISSTTNGAMDKTELILLAVQVVILLVYGIGIWRQSVKQSIPF